MHSAGEAEGGVCTPADPVTPLIHALPHGTTWWGWGGRKEEPEHSRQRGVARVLLELNSEPQPDVHSSKDPSSSPLHILVGNMGYLAFMVDRKEAVGVGEGNVLLDITSFMFMYY